MLIGNCKNLSAEDKKLLTKKCCICGTEFLGLGNDTYPYMENGECCNKCNFDYVLPCRLHLFRLGSNLTKKERKKELNKFRKGYHVFPYNFNEKLILEIGEQIIKSIVEDGIFNSTFMETNTLFDGCKIPIGTMSKSDTIDCMEKYLSTIGKTLKSWIQETGYKLYWNKILYCVAESESMKKTGCSCSDSAFVEPFIENDEDAIVRIAESPSVDATENVAST